MAAINKRGALGHLLRAPVYLYRWHLGWLLGHRFLLLTHTGRKTGLARETVLEVVDYRKDTSEAVVMSGFGRNSDWLRNIEVSPTPKITIGSQHFEASFRFLGEEEAIAVVQKYEQENWFMGPIVRNVLSRLLGWKYRGSDEDLRRLVGQLPLLAFRPRSGS